MDINHLSYKRKSGAKEVFPSEQNAMGRPSATKQLLSGGIKRSVDSSYAKHPGTIETRLFFIVSGGEKRERNYFHLLLQNENCIRRVKIVFVSCNNQGYNPSQMGNLAQDYLQAGVFNSKYTIESEDKIYLVSDVDEYREQLIEQINLSKRNSKLQWVISNPCFEIWLYYHFFSHPFDDLKAGLSISEKQRSQWLKKKLNQLRKGGINPVEAFKYARVAITNSSKFFRIDEDGIPVDYATQMHVLATDVLNSMGDEFDQMLVRLKEKAQKFIQLSKSKKNMVSNSHRKVLKFLEQLLIALKNYPLYLPTDEIGKNLSKVDDELFQKSYLVPNDLFAESTPFVENDLAEKYIVELNHQIKQYFSTQFYTHSTVKAVTIKFSEIKQAFDKLQLNKNDVAYCSFNLHTYDTLFGGSTEFKLSERGGFYGDVHLYRLPVNSHVIFIMPKEYAPKIRLGGTRKLPDGFVKLEESPSVMTNINSMTSLQEGLALSVGREISFLLPQDYNFRYIALNIVDNQNCKSYIHDLCSGDHIRLRYERGDFVMTSDKEIYSIAEIYDNGTIQLSFLDHVVSESDIIPVPVDGETDSKIYYDPIVAASFVLPGEPLPIRHTDYSYYVDAFRRHTFEGEKGTLYDKFILAKPVYVHEVQHWLRSLFGADDLKLKFI